MSNGIAMRQNEDNSIAMLAAPVSYTHLDVYKRQPFCWQL